MSEKAIMQEIEKIINRLHSGDETAGQFSFAWMGAFITVQVKIPGKIKR